MAADAHIAGAGHLVSGEGLQEFAEQQFQVRLQAVFNMINTSDDGEIDAEELQSMLDKLGVGGRRPGNL
jgi:hypothetical protein